ncbi:hypothetical protein RAS12_30765 (plasmid) [Achromobacter seleniivolatilans]|uniref:Uncharacterized protein n=1 Tax=Achromobacter seleniivolatilans TaxID=3047478 RepID=A0ABY9ME19_9BURK|nr:hypothetical protein [Achromobacter sp. R39]WMD24017.1 hypothetical protein RAS12_30765 [Achromobacter sp. R39]
MISRIEASLDADRPTAIIFSCIQRDGDGWEAIRGFTCGGFSCETLDGWGFLLPLNETGSLIAAGIADEEFCAGCKNPTMDYFGSNDEYREHQSAYSAYLAKHGLTVNSVHLKSLRQATYPIDATRQNMDVLLGPGRASRMPIGDDLVLILGHNCD